MKLEKKHLAPYLPYKLRVQYWDRNVVMNAGTGSSTHWIGITALLQRQGERANCFPILRPLSDLTKEIEVNGEKFIPIERLKLLFPEYPLLIEDDSIFFTDRCNLNMLEMTQINEIFQKLFEWHFDVFGLIKEGLAIDINTL